MAKAGRTNRRKPRRIPNSHYGTCNNGHVQPFGNDEKLCNVQGCRGWRVTGLHDTLLQELRHDWHLHKIHQRFLQRRAARQSGDQEAVLAA